MLAKLSLQVPIVPLSDKEYAIVNEMWHILLDAGDLATREKILGWLLAGVRAEASKNYQKE